MQKIIHIDMDAFYASVEQRDNPSYRGKPVVVSGPPNSRSVVCTASYEARKFGIHSAMPASQAYKLCPQAIFVFPRFSVYKEVSLQIQSIFSEYTELIEPLSLDEAYLDVTYNKKKIESAMAIAKEIKIKIFNTTKLTASAGVANGKFLAKIASGMNKPNGLTLIHPREAETFLETLPIGKFHGIGKVTESKLKEKGIHFGKDLKAKTEGELIQLLGKNGSYYFQIVHGVDNSKVIPNRKRKSLGSEETFSVDISEIRLLEEKLKEVAQDTSRRAKLSNLKGKTITLKLKFSDFEQITRSKSLPIFIQSEEEVYHFGQEILRTIEISKKVRLIGLSLSSFEDDSSQPMLQLF